MASLKNRILNHAKKTGDKRDDAIDRLVQTLIRTKDVKGICRLISNPERVGVDGIKFINAVLSDQSLYSLYGDNPQWAKFGEPICQVSSSYAAAMVTATPEFCAVLTDGLNDLLASYSAGEGVKVHVYQDLDKTQKRKDLSRETQELIIALLKVMEEEFELGSNDLPPKPVEDDTLTLPL